MQIIPQNLYSTVEDMTSAKEQVLCSALRHELWLHRHSISFRHLSWPGRSPRAALSFRYIVHLYSPSPSSAANLPRCALLVAFSAPFFSLNKLYVQKLKWWNKRMAQGKSGSASGTFIVRSSWARKQESGRPCVSGISKPGIGFFHQSSLRPIHLKMK